MVQLNRDLSLDSVLVIKNSRGVRTSVRVVSQTNAAGVYAYGLEFLEAENRRTFGALCFLPRKLAERQ